MINKKSIIVLLLVLIPVFGLFSFDPDYLNKVTFINQTGAAGEITELSKSSVDVSEKAKELLELLVPSIEQTSELIQEISASTSEQNAGSDNINISLQELSKVIQQNASASEEMASTAEELASQSEMLQDSMSYFKVGIERKSAETAVKLEERPDSTRIQVAEKQITYDPDTSIFEEDDNFEDF